MQLLRGQNFHTVTYTVRNAVEHADLMTSDSVGRDLYAVGWQSKFKLDDFVIVGCPRLAGSLGLTGAGPRLTTPRSSVVSSRPGKTPHQIGGRPTGNAYSGEVAIGGPDIRLGAASLRSTVLRRDRGRLENGALFGRSALPVWMHASLNRGGRRHAAAFASCRPARAPREAFRRPHRMKLPSKRADRHSHSLAPECRSRGGVKHAGLPICPQISVLGLERHIVSGIDPQPYAPRYGMMATFPTNAPQFLHSRTHEIS
jgi:hypothetical protein